MPTTDLLKTFGLSRNPFTDRTAEKTSHDSTSLYIHSDLRGFKPNDTTYVFFGKRGSGKTTIRLQASVFLQVSCKLSSAAVCMSQAARGACEIQSCLRAEQRSAEYVSHTARDAAMLQAVQCTSCEHSSAAFLVSLAVDDKQQRSAICAS